MTSSVTDRPSATYGMGGQMGPRMNQWFVREEVAAFRERNAYGRSERDCFPSWYLHHRYRVAASDAVAQSADSGEGGRRNFDFGLDAFHVLQESGESPVLLLVQAKYTDDLTAISAAFRDLQRSLPRVAEALTCSPSMAQRENRVLVMLRERLRHLDEDTRKALRLRFEVVHLSDADELIIRTNTRRAFDELRQAVSDDEVLESWRSEIDLVGPAKMGGAIPQAPKAPEIWHELNLSAVPLSVSLEDRKVTMYSGIGHLAELVNLYNQRRGDLFAKNVRYFLSTKQNEERGPSGKIKETLAYMCIPRKGVTAMEPELFAFQHNGVTVFARDVQQDADGSIRAIRDPYVLNGCQTVRSAYDFRYDARRSSKIDESRWARVAVPIRIITTQREDVIRQITISNNRQNQISPSALRANDEVQLELERRLRERGIFYERQRGALDELLRSNSAELDQYKHSHTRAVKIDDLARCLAAAAGEFDLAHSPSHIFESDTVYDRVFARERLSSLTLLVLLQNLHDVLPAILKSSDKDKQGNRSKKGLGLETTNPKAPRKSRLVYYTMCLLLRYLAKNGMEEWVGMYGCELLGREDGFREAVVKELGNHKSKIKQALQDHFLTLEDTTADSMREALRKASWSIKLRDTVDVFALFSGIDERLAEG